MESKNNTHYQTQNHLLTHSPIVLLPGALAPYFFFRILAISLTDLPSSFSCLASDLRSSLECLNLEVLLSDKALRETL